MKTRHDQKRLKLSTETLRTLRADEVQYVVGGADNEPVTTPRTCLSLSNCC
jgi:hypothetical protein